MKGNEWNTNNFGACGGRKNCCVKIERSKIITDGIGALKAEDLSEVKNGICDEWVWYMEGLRSKK